MIINTVGLFPDNHLSNYSTLLLSQYHLKIEGLWVFKDEYYILIPELTHSTLAIDGTPLYAWFKDHHLLGTHTNLTNKVPVGAVRLSPSTTQEQSDFAGSPRNYTFFLNDLLLNLPRGFPEFRLEDKNIGTLFFVTKNPLTASEELGLQSAVQKMRVSIRIETKTSENIEEIEGHFLKEPVLRHSKTFAGLKGPSKRRELWEADEDFWNERRGDLLNPSVKKPFYPENFDTNLSSCIVSDAFTPPNLRSFLTLYNTVYLIAPVVEQSKQYWESLNVTEDELSRLVEMNRVRILLTQPLQRYEPRLLDTLSELGDNKYLSPRRLAAITISDLRNRNPLLFPTFGDEVKSELLYHLYHKEPLQDQLPGGLEKKFLHSLSQMWGNFLEDVHRMGPNGLIHYSSYHFLDALFTSVGKNYGVELLDSIPSIEFAAALRANVIPKYWENYSNETMLTVVANLYSGIPKNMIPKKFPYSNTSVDKVLVVSDQVPIIDLAKTFTHSDIDRFRAQIFELTEHKKNQEELEDGLRLFNDHVINFEKSRDRLNTLDLSGFLIDAGLAATGVDTPLASWMIGRADSFFNKLGLKSGTIQILLDWLTVMKTDSGLPNAILVARMGKQLQKKWYQSLLRKKGF